VCDCIASAYLSDRDVKALLGAGRVVVIHEAIHNGTGSLGSCLTINTLRSGAM
jgi:hypothetical protein